MKRSFLPRRRAPIRRYKKRFVIAIEGRVTERDYFESAHFRHAVVHVKCVPRKHSSTAYVLRGMEDYLAEHPLDRRYNDEAWLVVDKDQSLPEQLDKLTAWANPEKSRFLAVSNPRFELWLLMHFQKPTAATDFERLLKKACPGFLDEKHLDMHKVVREQIEAAVECARKKDTTDGRGKDWPQKQGVTTVYILVKRILDALG